MYVAHAEGVFWRSALMYLLRNNLEIVIEEILFLKLLGYFSVNLTINLVGLYIFLLCFVKLHLFSNLLG